MSLEGEVPTHGYVEDNETMKQADDKKVGDNHVGGSKIKDNGTVLTNNDTEDAQLDVNTSSPPLCIHRTTTEGAQAVNPQQPADNSLPHQSPQSTKGYGLKKWRRVKRDKVLNPESSSSVSMSKTVHLSSGGIKRSDVVLPFSMMKNIGVTGASTVQDSSSDSRFGNGVATAAAVDSKKSEDRSSESSTAASAPRVKYDAPAGLEKIWDKKLLHSGGKSVDSSKKSQESQHESSKRPRGERVKVMEDCSHSSIESDSRSSNFVFAQDMFSFPENEDQIRTSMKHVRDNNNKAHSSEQHDQEFQTVNGEQVADDVEENDRPISQDPFVESIFALQSVEKALETELQKLREMGKEAASLHLDLNLVSSSPVESTSEVAIHAPISSDQLDEESINRETQVSTLRESVNHLESKLKESTALLEKKEMRIIELEATIIGSNQLEGQPHVTLSQQDRLLEMEPELEELFLLKIEAEVEYLVLIRTVMKLREDLQELSREQSAVLNKLREIENKADVTKKQAVDLETRAGYVLGMAEALKLQKRVCSVSSYFFIQLVLLILVFWLVASQLSPHPVMYVPT